MSSPMLMYPQRAATQLCVCVYLCCVNISGKWTHLNALTRWSDGSGGQPSNRVHNWSTVWAASEMGVSLEGRQQIELGVGARRQQIELGVGAGRQQIELGVVRWRVG